MARATYDYPTDISFCEAGRIALDSSFRKMMKNAGATRTGVERSEPLPDEVEALHDMRVGSRRIRAALAVFGRAFSKADFQELDRQVAAITDALGAVRDLDVQLDALRSIHASVPEHEAHGIGRLISRQADQRDVERHALLVALDRLEKERFERRFLKALDRALGPVAQGAEGAESPAGGSANG
jgi:CHAD domain-containing protein